MMLTQSAFAEFKSDFAVYGTHGVTDRYGNQRPVKDANPRGTIHTMWHPLTDAASIAEYGKDISTMYYAIVYDNPGIQHGDIITLRGDEYEVVSVKRFNTHDRVDIRRKKV